MEFNFSTKAKGETLLNLNVVGGENVYLLLSKVNYKLTDLRPAWSGVASILSKEAEETWATQGRHIEYVWSPLSEKYLERKFQICGTTEILVCTGNLRNSVVFTNAEGHIERKEKLLFEFGTSVPYGIYHQAGTKKFPARKFLGVSGKAVGEIAGLLKKYIVVEGGIGGRKYEIGGEF